MKLDYSKCLIFILDNVAKCFGGVIWDPINVKWFCKELPISNSKEQK